MSQNSEREGLAEDAENILNAKIAKGSKRLSQISCLSLIH